MDKDKLQYYRRRLIEEKKKLLKSLNNINNMEEYGSMDVYHSDISGYDNHPADIATEVFMMEQDNGFKNKSKKNIQEIDNALANIKNGRYGICEICNKEIDNKRLDLIPYSTSCIECAKEFTPLVDTSSNARFIAIEEEEASSFTDTDEEMIEFDREDAYQDVVSFNVVTRDHSFSTGDNLNVMDEQDGDDGDEVEEIEKISQEYYNETLS